MKAHELFQEMKPATASSVFQYLRDEQREVYTASLASLASNRKLRPVFIQRKPVPAQIDWMVRNIRLKTSNEIAEHVLQLWLMKGHSGLLTAFLDGLGIEHDGEGAAEDIPDEIDAKKLQSTVDKLLKDHDPELVAVYLQVFQTQRPGGWDEIRTLIDSRPELQLGEPKEAAETGSEAKDEAEPEEEAPEKETAAKKKTVTKKAAKKKTASEEEE